MGSVLELGTCQICYSLSIEDECHFILICNEYNELRINPFNSMKYILKHLNILMIENPLFI